MKEYNIKFGDDYKQALANTESDVQAWVENLRSMQEDINALLNDTEKSDETKQKELEQMVQLVPESNNKEEHMETYKSQLIDNGIKGDELQTMLDQYSQAYDNAQSIVDEGERQIANIIKTHMDENGNITEEGMKLIADVRTSVQDEIAQVTSSDLDTSLAMTESYFAQQDKLYKGAEKGTVEATRNMYKTQKEEREKELRSQKEFIDGLDTLSEQQKQNAKNRIDSEIAMYDGIEKAQESSLLRRAMYDQEYANKNGLAVQQVNENMWTVIDTNTGVETSFFDNAEAMRQYAESMGKGTALVSDEFGQMHEVILDTGGNVVGMVDDMGSSFSYFSTDAYDAMQKVIDQSGVAEGTAEQKFSAICNAIDNGTLSAKDYGMTDEEFRRVAQEMANGATDAEDLKNKVNNIPKQTNVKVETEVNGEDKVDNLLTKLANGAGKVWDFVVNVITGGDSKGKKALGGSVSESGIYNVNERGIETLSSGSGVMLSSAVEGDYAYLSANSNVNTAMMTEIKMGNMITEEVNRQSKAMYNAMVRALRDSNISNGGVTNNYDIDINNPNFQNPNDAKQKLDELSRIILRTKK